MAYTTIDDPSAYFQTKLYTGNGSTQSITNDGNSDLQPDLVWTKARSNTSHNALVDSSRGTSIQIYTNLTYQDDPVSGVTAFNTDGFTLGSNGTANADGVTHVAWQWKANGGTTASNTDGSITSTVQANQDAGFSIVTYTVGIAGGNHSVGHGLGVAPDFIAIKCRGTAQDWLVYHSSLGSGNYIKLNTTAGSVAYADSFGDGVTSSVFGYNYAGTAIANQPYVAYCFAEKQGYSKFGKYVGNGGADGPFVYTGFKPAFLMVKRTDAGSSNWQIKDSARNPSNLADKTLFPNTTQSEYSTFYFYDLLSNGFKVRGTDAELNDSGGTYIFMAFSENPFVTSTGVPTTAR